MFQIVIPLKGSCFDPRGIIRVCSVKIEGFFKYKNDQLFLNYLSAFDLFGMCETWGNQSGDFDETLPDYTHFDFIRSKNPSAVRNSGGVTVFVRKYLVSKGFVKRICDDLSDVIVLLVDKSFVCLDQSIIMIFVYISPEGSTIYRSTDYHNGIERLSDQIIHITSLYPDSKLFLAGDFNSRIKNFADYIADDDVSYIFNSNVDYPSDQFERNRKSKDTKYNNYGLSLIELCCAFDVHVFNGRLFNDGEGEYTCLANDGASVVDYMIASSALFCNVTNFGVDDYCFGAHFPLYCEFQFVYNLQMPVIDVFESDSLNVNLSRIYWKNEKKDEFLQNFNTELNNIHIGDVPTSSITALPQLMSAFRKAAKCMVNLGNKNVKDSKQPLWWKSSCRNSKKRKQFALRNFRSSNSINDLQRYKEARNLFKFECQKAKNKWQTSNRNKLFKYRKDAKQFWRLIKDNSFGYELQSNSISGDKWVSHFRKVLCVPSSGDDVVNTNDILSGITHDCNNETLNVPITDDEVIHAVNHIRVSSSPGPDGISMHFYKNTLHLILPFLKTLFNEIFDSGNIPKDWGESLMVPVHKNGPRDDPNNYRGISLINSLCKIFTCILNNRLQKWCDRNNIIHEEQAGFRKEYGTIDNIFNLMAIIQKYLGKRIGRFYCIFIDFSKAFDSVQHLRLWDSLSRKNIDGKFLNALKSMYSNLTSCIRLPNGYTEFFKCNIGTRQGCIGSPLIFSLFINDIVDYLNQHFQRGITISADIADICTFLYADDVSNFSETAIQLQHQIDCIEQFCNAVNMNINLDKTKIVVFSNGGDLRHYETWTYNGRPIQSVPCYKYLGLYFKPNLSWSFAHEYASKQASKAIAAIFRYQKKNLELSVLEMHLNYLTVWLHQFCATDQKYGDSSILKKSKKYI